MMKVVPVLAKSIIALFSLFILLILLVTFRPKITSYGLLLSYEASSMRSYLQTTTLISFGMKGVLWKKLDGTWHYSPDGLYAVSMFSRPSSIGITVLRTDTFEGKCFDIKQPNINDPLRCSFLELSNGQWWSPTHGVVMSRPNTQVTNAVSIISESPDGQWLLMQSAPSYIINSEWNYGMWSLIHRTADIQWDFDIPVVDGTYCSVIDQYAWRDDSKQFTIQHNRQNHTFIWEVEDNGPPQLIDTIAMDSC